MEREIYEQMESLGESHWWFKAKREIIISFLDRHFAGFDEGKKKIKILDIGCGTGLFLKSLEKYGEVFAIDKDERALKYAKNKILNPQNIRKGFLPEAIPFDIKFDLIAVLDVLEHVADDRGSLEKIKEMLAPDGHIFCTVPAFNFFWSGHDVRHQHQRRYTLRKIRELFGEAGFQIEKITYFNTFLFLPILFFRRLKIFLGRDADDFKESNAVLNWLLEKIFSAERYFLSKFNFPFGVSILIIAKSKDKVV